MGLVDITSKEIVYRYAEASGSIKLKKTTLKAIKDGSTPKGDPLTVAKVAAIAAAKNTWSIIPFCHQISLTSVDVASSLDVDRVSVKIAVKSAGKTGVEMEALTAVSVYLLTIWDMVKPLEKDTQGQYPNTSIEQIKIRRKIKTLEVIKDDRSESP